jgi:Methyltransferase domain
MRHRNAARSVTDVFSEIYARAQWGTGRTFDSGSGSSGGAAVRYAAYVRDLVRETGARSAVDIGCGDFRVASQFVDALRTYHGVDVVPALVARNSATYGRPGVTFSVLDAASGEPPVADICLVRQVLQHLSNRQIAEILRRCRRYALVVVTEHWPAPGAGGRPNVDKPHGPDTRLDRGSWVDITQEPFSCTAVDEVMSVPVDAPIYRPGETIRTQLWRPQPD